MRWPQYHRLHDQEAHDDAGAGVAPCFLYFGCRSRAADFYYEDQWKRYQQEGILARQGGLRVAFSREGSTKRYVTHLLRDDAAHIWQLLQQVICKVPVQGDAGWLVSLATSQAGFRAYMMPSTAALCRYSYVHTYSSP